MQEDDGIFTAEWLWRFKMGATVFSLLRVSNYERSVIVHQLMFVVIGLGDTGGHCVRLEDKTMLFWHG